MGSHAQRGEGKPWGPFFPIMPRGRDSQAKDGGEGRMTWGSVPRRGKGK